MKILDYVVPKSMRVNRFGDLFKIVGVGAFCYCVFKVAEIFGSRIFFSLIIGFMVLVIVAMLTVIYSQWRDPAVQENVKRGFHAWRNQNAGPDSADVFDENKGKPESPVDVKTKINN